MTLACFDGAVNWGADAVVPLSSGAPGAEYLTYLSAALSGSDCVWYYHDGNCPAPVSLSETLGQLPRRVPSARWICFVFELCCSGFVEQLAGISGGTWEYAAESQEAASEVERRAGAPCARVPRGLAPEGSPPLSTRLSTLAERSGWWDADAVFAVLGPVREGGGLEAVVGLLGGVLRRGFVVKFVMPFASVVDTPEAAGYIASLKEFSRVSGCEEHIFWGAPSGAMALRERQSLFRIADGLLLPAGGGLGGLAMAPLGLGKPVFCFGACPEGDDWTDKVSFPELPVEALSEWFISRLQERETIQARRKILRDYRWQSIYHHYIEALLLRPPILHHP